jgi:hypothetical protein
MVTVNVSNIWNFHRLILIQSLVIQEAFMFNVHLFIKIIHIFYEISRVSSNLPDWCCKSVDDSRAPCDPASRPPIGGGGEGQNAARRPASNPYWPQSFFPAFFSFTLNVFICRIH